MFARVEKLKYRNYPKNSNSRKGSSRSWKLLISPQSSKPTLPQTRRWISDPKSAWQPPLSTRPSFSIRGNETPSRNTSESDRIENGSSWRRAAGRRGEGWRYQRSHRWKSRSRGSREREREREGRRRKLFSLFEIEIYRIYFTLFSVFFYSFLSLSLSNHDSRDDRWCGYHEGTSWRHLSSLPSFILHPANDTFSTQLSLASVISYSSGHLSDWKIVSRRSFNRERSFVSFRSLKILEEKRKKRRKFQLASSRGGKKLAPKSGLVTWIMTRVDGGK